MTVERFANNAITTLAAAINSGQTSFDVADGSVLPTLSGGDQFRCRVDSELMIVGTRSGNTLSSITRGAEGTTNTSHNSGATLAHDLTAGSLQNVLTSLTSDSAVLTSDQTLSSADTLTDLTGCSLSLAAGTWIILAQAKFELGGSTYGLLTIADSGNTDYSAALGSGSSIALAESCSAKVTPSSTTTYKLRAQAGGTTTVVKKQGDNAGQVMTRMLAIKIA